MLRLGLAERVIKKSVEVTVPVVAKAMDRVAKSVVALIPDPAKNEFPALSKYTPVVTPENTAVPVVGMDAPGVSAPKDIAPTAPLAVVSSRVSQTPYA